MGIKESTGKPTEKLALGGRDAPMEMKQQAWVLSPFIISSWMGGRLANFSSDLCREAVSACSAVRGGTYGWYFLHALPTELFQPEEGTAIPWVWGPGVPDTPVLLSAILSMEAGGLVDKCLKYIHYGICEN